MRRTLHIARAALILAAAAHLGAQQSSPADTGQPRYGTRADAVLVDVSVTDRKGRPVTDLTAADFQIFEDGAGRRVAGTGGSGRSPSS
jgi:hypothetical protein